ncbi:winged helix-turn-helix transcriptional regulator [Amycolatopsis saalfeldensis]|uniref:winged helix-turn-helix transcriptional regulator n=1 Tax=Amycolatopsis saalfeldensis TaxID=394193 RepID=UPI003CCBC132
MRSLDDVGQWWGMLILRDAFDGFTRFDEFERNLGIAPNLLTRRLRKLVEAGLLERRRYQDRPPLHEYVLAPRRPRVPPGADHPGNLRRPPRTGRFANHPADGPNLGRAGGGRARRPPLGESGLVFPVGPGAGEGMRECYSLSSKD